MVVPPFYLSIFCVDNHIFSKASSAPLTKMRAKCIWEALDAINKVRLCFLTQNYTNNQSKIQNNASSAFWDKM